MTVDKTIRHLVTRHENIIPMKKTLTILICSLISVQCSLKSLAQEYATFELTGVHQGTGNFNDAALSDFTWNVEGTLAQEVQILDDEVFDDGNQFENMFGQANFAQNLRVQVVPNAIGSIGQPATSKAILTLNFDQLTPANKWGFCIVDLDVENCLISAIDENNNQVSVEDIDDWLIELFDADLVADGVNIPKWDASHAALLGSDTPEDYVVYNNLVIGGMPSNEASAAFFMPDIPLKSLILYFENLQYGANVSLHFYFASLEATGLQELSQDEFEVYPNPADNIVHCRLPILHFPCEVELYDVYGKHVMKVQTIESNSKNTEIDVSHLPLGVYFIRVQAGERIGVRKLIIQ